MSAIAPDLRRVVVTGVGVISAIGLGKDAFWSAALAGRCGTAPIEGFDCSRLRARRGCEVRDFDPGRHPEIAEHRIVGRASQFAVAAARMAMDDAGLATPLAAPPRVGVSFGTTGGEIQIMEALCRARARGAPMDRVLCEHFPCYVIPGAVARVFGARGPHQMFPNACAAGNYAIGYGHDLIKAGRADVVIAGGVEAFSEISFLGFCRLNTVAPDWCRPFDKNRRGIILGEGAGVMILESLEHAARRGARAYAEIGGYGVSCDSYHLTSPEPAGRGMRSAMQRALRASACAVEEVDYVSAHGSGTQVNDEVETRAIKDLFGDHARRLRVSALKAMVGHTMGAASAIQAVSCALAVHTGSVPPTINYETPDPACDLDYVPNRAVAAPVTVAINNAFAFGGKNTCLLLRKPAPHRAGAA
ncbi:MAG: beta-ketoacyl-[acyl-carrier-protein] synthase family protein [Polyangiaceae bacterium]|nr:beta-ketoacyl-[acyl-carrier-protein] synthase family protein [Polyangiaceae bacterium]